LPSWSPEPASVTSTAVVQRGSDGGIRLVASASAAQDCPRRRQAVNSPVEAVNRCVGGVNRCVGLSGGRAESLTPRVRPTRTASALPLCHLAMLSARRDLPPRRPFVANPHAADRYTTRAGSDLPARVVLTSLYCLFAVPHKAPRA